MLDFQYQGGNESSKAVGGGTRVSATDPCHFVISPTNRVENHETMQGYFGSFEGNS